MKEEMKINKKINQFYFIFNELKENTNEEFSTEDLIKATNDLIKYSKNDFVEKSFFKSYDNDNRKSLDQVFTRDNNYLPSENTYLSYDDFLSTQKSMRQAAQDWYAPNENHKNPMISPVFANFKSFPNTLIQVSDIEILFSDSINLKKKLKQNNNKVVLSIYKNLPHVWQIFGFLPEAKKAVNEIALFLKE